ncbi:hypothetical protein [Azovibrio sp.]
MLERIPITAKFSNRQRCLAAANSGKNPSNQPGKPDGFGRWHLEMIGL